MSRIQLTNLPSAGSALFQGGESFLTELQSTEAHAIYGGKKGHGKGSGSGKGSRSGKGSGSGRGYGGHGHGGPCSPGCPPYTPPVCH
jgi:hypothetical protein